ncbi:MarR family winged helix-turn-helix transcriptional regulator [Paenibacillus lutrae]|uniref:MarR family transcriptional regulator n=1 Tax=Paenibacillus lutrae TaxID=2078573 RepID=A0A7X3FL03_9BACL|nr:MarR family transcriptional regulator [Paenibacillus lutrae]MVP01648.1 MarR family transcriptional regulator [Paenibacillus lutrae]
MDEKILADVIVRYENASFTVNRRINAMIKDGMPEGLTLEQYGTLKYLQGHDRSTSSELASIFCVGKSSITAIITRLFDKQLITRQPDDKDRRVTYLSLTDKGGAAVDAMHDKIKEMLGTVIQHFDEHEAIAFVETFEKLAQVLVQPDEGDIEKK